MKALRCAADGPAEEENIRKLKEADELVHYI